jgi:hypothetical protein
LATRKPQLKEVPIFPNPCERGHNYSPLYRAENGEIRGYYPVDDKGNKDRTKVMGTLYCTRCGETKDIVIVNYERS